MDWWLAVIFSLAIATGVARAQTSTDDVARFYASHPLHIIVGSSTGGYYDTAARAIARHIGRFLPGRPEIIVENQPAAGGLAIANRLEGGVANDGGTIVVMSRALPQLALMSDPSASFDPLKLIWLGSLSSYADDGYIMTVRADNAVRSLSDIRPPLERALNLAGTRAGSTNIGFALLARDLLGLNIRVIRGFPGASEIWLAMDRHEVDGQFVDLSAIQVARAQAWRDKKLRGLVVFGRNTRFPDYPDIPTARELVSNPKDLSLLDFAELPFHMALPAVTPVGVPPQRAQALRTAFTNMARDPGFTADMLNIGILTSPIDGQAVQDLIARAAQSPPEVRARFSKLLNSP